MIDNQYVATMKWSLVFGNCFGESVHDFLSSK